MRQLPLKSSGTKVKYFSDDTKHPDVYEAVVDMGISNRDLQQCADAIMLLKSEYLYSTKAYDKISFNLANGFKMVYSKWMVGNRLRWMEIKLLDERPQSHQIPTKIFETIWR